MNYMSFSAPSFSLWIALGHECRKQSTTCMRLLSAPTAAPRSNSPEQTPPAHQYLPSIAHLPHSSLCIRQRRSCKPGVHKLTAGALGPQTRTHRSLRVVNITFYWTWIDVEQRGNNGSSFHSQNAPRMFHVQGLHTVCTDAIEKKSCETLSGSERGTHSPALSLHVPDIVLPSSVSYPPQNKVTEVLATSLPHQVHTQVTQNLITILQSSHRSLHESTLNTQKHWL